MAHSAPVCDLTSLALTSLALTSALTSLALTLALTLAHPPYEVEKNASEVVHAASVIMHDFNASLNSSVGQWDILSSRKQLVSGFNYFLVFGVEVLGGGATPSWLLVTASAYTSFSGATNSDAFVIEPAGAAEKLEEAESDADAGCSAELPGTSQATAVVEVTKMMNMGGGSGGGMMGGGGGMMGGGGGMMGGGGGMSFESHDEYV